MVASRVTPAPSQRALPPTLAIDEGCINEDQCAKFLSWTFTPDFMSHKEGHSRCFVATVQPMQKTRVHAPHLVRELEIQPLCLELKDILTPKLPPIGPALEIRVREEDFRKWGGNLDMLNQCALPCLKQNIHNQFGEYKKKGTHKKARRCQVDPFHDILKSTNAEGRILPSIKRCHSVPAMKSSSSAGEMRSEKGGGVVRLPSICEGQCKVDGKTSSLRSSFSLPSLV